MDGAAFSHIELVQRQRTFDRPTLTYARHVPQLRNIERTPLHARQVPLQTRPEQATLDSEQALLLPGQAFAAGSDFPGIARFPRLAGPARDITVEAVHGHGR
ncbi:hypothetical protein D3C72_2068580 [compost metagenome]